MSLDEILKEYKNNIFTGKYLIDHPKPILSISPNLDIVLGGGIPNGSAVIIGGKFKCGKSTTALHIAKKALEAGKNVHYDDIEGRLKKRDIEGIQGLNPDKINIIRSSKGNILSAEKHLSMVDNLIKEDPGSLIIMDSISQLYSEKQMTEGVEEMGRNPISIMLSNFCKRMENIIPINDNIVVMIVHIISNTSGFGNPWSESGGNKIQYAADIKLRCKSTEDWNVGSGENQKQIGQKIKWEIETTALNAPPGRTCKSYLKYGFGIDEVAELVDTALELGIVNKKGAWYNCDLLGKDSFHGQENLIEKLRENKEGQEKVTKAIKEIIL